MYKENKYLLDLLSEGRMINSTLENLEDVVQQKTDTGEKIDFYNLPSNNELLKTFDTNDNDDDKQAPIKQENISDKDFMTIYQLLSENLFN